MITRLLRHVALGILCFWLGILWAAVNAVLGTGLKRKYVDYEIEERERNAEDCGSGMCSKAPTVLTLDFTSLDLTGLHTTGELEDDDDSVEVEIIPGVTRGGDYIPQFLQDLVDVPGLQILDVSRVLLGDEIASGAVGSVCKAILLPQPGFARRRRQRKRRAGRKRHMGRKGGNWRKGGKPAQGRRRQVAVKKVALRDDYDSLLQLRREIELLTSLAGKPGILRLRAVVVTNDEVMLVTDYHPSNLEEWIDKHPFKERSCLHERAAMALKIARVAATLDQYAVFHRDLKPDNILLDRNGDPVFCDFGQARLDPVYHPACDHGPLTKRMRGTVGYVAPEIIRNKAGFTSMAEVYGFGAVLAHMLTGEAAGSGMSYGEYVDQTKTGKRVQKLNQNDFGGQAAKELLDIIRVCTAAQADQRPVAFGPLVSRLEAYCEALQQVKLAMCPLRGAR